MAVAESLTKTVSIPTNDDDDEWDTICKRARRQRKEKILLDPELNWWEKKVMLGCGEHEFVLCCSLGKDSIATIQYAIDHNMPLDRIITVMPDPFDLEEEFRQKVRDHFNFEIEVVDSPSFEDFFFQKKVKGKYKGTIYGWFTLFSYLFSR